VRQKLFFFTPLESPAACPVRSSASIGACSGDEDIIPFRANTEFNAPCEPPRWKVEDFLTGFICHSGLDLACPVLDTGESSVFELDSRWSLPRT